MSKMTALEAYKIKIVLDDVSCFFRLFALQQYVKINPNTDSVLTVPQMNEKLEYLEQLKNNVGEEMAEGMSDEITKVMDEQRQIEMEYARLVQQRDQLKGITNKHKL